MPLHAIPLDRELLLHLRIAWLERDLAQAQAHLLQTQAMMQHQLALMRLLAEAQIWLPVPITACAFDLEHGQLTYEEPPPGG